MADPIKRRSTRSRKPITHFDDKILQSSKPSKPSSAPKAVIVSTKATKSSAKPSIKLSTKLSIEPSTSTEPSTKSSTKPSTSDPIQQVCTQTEELLDYSKLVEPQLWKEPGPHNWTERPTRQSCIMCCKKEKLRKKVLARYEGIELFKEIATNKVKAPAKSWAGCSYCDVPLCKTSTR